MAGLRFKDEQEYLKWAAKAKGHPEPDPPKARGCHSKKVSVHDTPKPPPKPQPQELPPWAMVTMGVIWSVIIAVWIGVLIFFKALGMLLRVR